LENHNVSSMLRISL